MGEDKLDHSLSGDARTLQTIANLNSGCCAKRKSCNYKDNRKAMNSARRIAAF